MDRRELLEKAPIATVFLKYALPSIITMCFFGLQNLVDGYVVGNYVSEKALGGVNIITPLFQFCNGDCYFTRSGIHRYRDAHFAYFFRRTRHLAYPCAFGSTHFSSKYIARSKVGGV